MRRVQQQSIWHRPLRIGLLLGVLAALSVMFLLPGVPGMEPAEAFNDRVWAILYEGLRWFVIGFFATVILLTYVRVAERER